VHLKFPLNSKLLGDKDCLHWIWPVKKKLLLFLSIAVLLVFLYLIAAYASARQCVIIIWENLGVTQAYTLKIQLLRWRELRFH
jgi:hypothetical protein